MTSTPFCYLFSCFEHCRQNQAGAPLEQEAHRIRELAIVALAALVIWAFIVSLTILLVQHFT